MARAYEYVATVGCFVARARVRNVALATEASGRERLIIGSHHHFMLANADF